MKKSKLLTLGVGTLLAVCGAAGHAQAGFSASVSPPRVEIQIKAGQTQRQVIDIFHGAPQAGRYRVYTNDWAMQGDGSIVFDEALSDKSCRPWVALEKRELTIPGNTRHRYRFEVSAPSLIPDGECRFAIMVEGLEPVQVQQEGIAVPVTGRIGVIVYVNIGDAKPQLKLAAHRAALAQGQVVPVIDVVNEGNAHGRLDGVIEGVDADGRKLEFLPSNLPVLPGQTRAIALTPVAEQGKPPVVVKYPLAMKGSLEVGKQRLPLDLRFDAP